LKIIWYQKIGRSPNFPPKRGALDILEHSAPLLREKGFPMDLKKKKSQNFKIEFLPNPTVQKMPTGYTN
jgi:hypothetical protein